MIFIGGSISAMEPRSDSQRGDREEGECWCMMGRGPLGPVCVCAYDRGEKELQAEK